MSNLYKDFLGESTSDYFWREDMGPDKIEEWYEDNFSDINITEEEYMPDGILGMADPYSGDILIDNNLSGELKERVIDHEALHVQAPYLSEWQVRVATDTTPQEISYMMSDYNF